MTEKSEYALREKLQQVRSGDDISYETIIDMVKIVGNSTLETETREYAICLLEHLTKRNPKLVQQFTPVFLHHLKHDRRWIRFYSAEALVNVSEENPELVVGSETELLSLLKEEKPDLPKLRRTLLDGLITIALHSPGGLAIDSDEIIDLVPYDDESERLKISELLTIIYLYEDEECRVVKLATSDEPELRQGVYVGLQKIAEIDPNQAIEKIDLVNLALEDNNSFVRREGAMVLQYLSDSHPEIVAGYDENLAELTDDTFIVSELASKIRSDINLADD